MSASLTVDQALKHAQFEQPTDLVARLEHIQMHMECCDEDDWPIWLEVERLTRNGVA